MKNKIIGVALFIIISLVFILLCIPKVESKVEQEREQKRLDGILEQINQLYEKNEEFTNEWNRLESEQQDIHNSAELNREEIKRLWNEYYKDKDELGVMDVICEKSPTSPMCNNYEMLEKLKKVANERGVDYTLLLGIMYAESHIGANFNAEQCKNTNNWGGVKARKYDDGTTSEWFDQQENKIDGCWLYNFEKVEEFFESLANTIAIGYKGCNGDVYCISKSYVGHESGSRVNNVYKFYKLSR